MKLSIVVVNHDACYQLKQTLTSLINASLPIDSEFIVADNSSADDSMTMLQSDFPQVQIICNESKSGIAKAGNSAIKLSSGEFILFLSPGIISCKDSLQKMISFLDVHPDSGGLSVRMLTSQGSFLPESIHGLTKQWKAFFKLIGFDRYLSKTRLYNRNYKDWVEEFQVAEVDVLNSTCMLLRRSAFNTTGLFDERFFTTGHNIDLSYRLRLAGFKNYYFPKTYMINSGASETTLFNWNNIKNTVGAMLLFAIKYLIKVPELKVQDTVNLLPTSYEVK